MIITIHAEDTFDKIQYPFIIFLILQKMDIEGNYLNSGHRTGKGQFSFQSLRNTMAKNAQTATQLYSSHTLSK